MKYSLTFVGFATWLALAAWPRDATAASLPGATLPAIEPIVGGERTAPGVFDAVVLLRIGNLDCTGTLVDPQVVLTAAHCFKGHPNAEDIHVYFGSDATGAAMAAESYGVHWLYCDTCSSTDPSFVERFDLAYVTLPEPYAPMDGIVQPLTEQGEWDDTMIIGNVVELVGFGLSDDPDSPSSVKRRVSTILDDFSEYGLEFFAGQEGTDRDSCNGDSGGPAIVWNRDGEPRLAGVTSRGSNPCGQGGWYSVPFPALTWLDSEAGTRLVPAACKEHGDCLDITPPDGGRCAVAGRPGAMAWLWFWLLFGLGRRRPVAPTVPGAARQDRGLA